MSPAVPELVLIALLTAWSVVVLVALALRLHGGELTGADSPFPSDQLQYFSWIRDSGAHGLAGDLFEIPAGGRVFLHPMWFVSGLLWRAGVSLAVAGLVWKPFVVVGLVLGVRAYVARMVPGRAWSRLAIFLLAVGYVSPIGLFTSHGAALSGETFTAGLLWGYLPSVLAVALMPVYLLSMEQAINAEANRHPLALPTLAGAGLLLAWLHPWQGETIALITVALLVWRRARGAKPLLVGLVAVALPLAGYFALSHFDSAWRHAQAAEDVSPGSLLDLFVALGPLAALAIAGVRRVGDDFQEQALALWPLAALLEYFVFAPSFASHSLEGIAIPLGVLACRGATRLVRALPLSSTSRESWIGPASATVALVLTIPGAIHATRTTLRLVGDGRQGQIADASELSALRYLEALPGNGGVLAPASIGAIVPAFTGKPTWVGHPAWTPDFYERQRFANALARGAVPLSLARKRVHQSKARYVLLGCGSPSLTGLLGPLVAATHRFGCAEIYTLR